MQRGRNLLFLLVLGLGLGAYVYFVEMKREPTSATADGGGGSGSESRKKVFGDGLEAAKIEELRLTSSSGDRTTLKKARRGARRSDAVAARTWQIVEPIQSAVDETEVTSVTSNLATLESTRVVEENAKDLAKYGLAEPKVEVAFKTAGDKDYRRLFVGGKTPTGGDLYAKLANDSKVLLIPAYLESSLDRSTFQMRDKSILKFERDQGERRRGRVRADVDDVHEAGRHLDADASVSRAHRFDGDRRSDRPDRKWSDEEPRRAGSHAGGSPQVRPGEADGDRHADLAERTHGPDGRHALAHFRRGCDARGAWHAAGQQRADG